MKPFANKYNLFLLNKLLLKSYPLTSAAARVCLFLAASFALLMPIFFIVGFPIPFLQGTPFKVKSLRKLFEIASILFVVGLALHPRRSEKTKSLVEKLNGIAQFPGTIWILAAVYFVLFLWQQISKYWALEINFIPFLFYDYMLWYFEQGKVCFTGLLHGYYHLNLIMYLLYPVWKIFQSPWLLHIASSFIVALSAVPYYFWSKARLKNPVPALVFAFLFLNYRFTQNLLDVNFAVEVFYPLFILSAVYFAEIKKNVLYFSAVALGLLVKEDSFIYFGALGLLYLVIGPDRKRGAMTLLLACLYPILLLKAVIPWSGSTILRGDLNNFSDMGHEMDQIGLHMLNKPWVLIQQLFVPLEKVRTLFKLTSKLLFLPLISPWFFLVLAAVAPVFSHSGGRGDQFFQLAFYYGAPALPFVFLALTDSWHRLEKWIRPRPYLYGSALVALVFLNGFNLRPLHFTQDDVKTVQLAQTLPSDRVVVTQGHLLPYIGYRKLNFYVSDQYLKRPDTKEIYPRADYFLFDFEANAYPKTTEDLRQMAELLRRDPQYRITFEDHRRLLLEKKPQAIS